MRDHPDVNLLEVGFQPPFELHEPFAVFRRVGDIGKDMHMRVAPPAGNRIANEFMQTCFLEVVSWKNPDTELSKDWKFERAKFQRLETDA